MEPFVEQQKLINVINYRLERDELVLPTLPDIALEVNEKLIDENSEINDIVNLIKKDPAIAANVIKFANTVLVKGNIPIKTLNQATIRIGFKALRNITMSFAIQQMFFAKDVAFALDLYTSWKQASDSAVVSCALLDYLHERKIGLNLNQDVIFLIGLVHNIGLLPVLTEADRLGKEVNSDFLNKEFISNICASTGTYLTKRILSSWKFDKEVIIPSYKWSDGKYFTNEISYLDVFRLSLTITSDLPSELKSTFYNEAIRKGIIENKDWASEKTYKEALIKYKNIFYSQ
jgi:HD-like signal output (HDOD) protein